VPPPSGPVGYSSGDSPVHFHRILLFLFTYIWTRSDSLGTVTVGILQYNPIQSAILRDLIGQFPATELDYIVVCPQCVMVR
jgi:hypothetical protein